MGIQVGVAIIARNAGQTIGDCIESFEAYVDQIVVVLAGESTDDTAREAKRASRKVELYDFDWIDDFSAARNFSFSKMHTDWILWVDADDIVLHPGNISKAIKLLGERFGCIWLPYEYATDEFGNLTTLYERERLLKSSIGWIWKDRLHETVSPVNPCEYTRYPEVVLKHNHLAGESRSPRNFKLLDLMYKENPENRRVWLYHGHQHFASGHWMDAVEWYLRFSQDRQVVPLEKYQALCYCAKAMRELKNRQAIDIALMGIELYPQYKDAYLELAQSYYTVGDVDKAIHWANEAQDKEQPPPVIFINPLDYTFNAFIMLAECYYAKGQLETSMRYFQKAYSIRAVPDIQRRIELTQTLIKRNVIDRGIKALAVDLLESKELTKLAILPSIVPYWYRDLPDYQDLKGGVAHYTATIPDIPQTIREGKKAIINLSHCLNPQKEMESVEDCDVTLIAPLPPQDLVKAYSQQDIEELVTSKPGRRIFSLRRGQDKIVCEYTHILPDKLAIRMLVGRGLQYWNPQTILELGEGGSETGAAYLCKELSNLGCQPILYAMDNQVWDGVIYRTNFNPQFPPCDLFISSRTPAVFYEEIPSTQKWLWCHDIDYGTALTPEVVSTLDIIWCLSYWHYLHLKKAYPWLQGCEVLDYGRYPRVFDDEGAHPERVFPASPPTRLPKILILGDGIDMERYETITEERIPHRFIWLSSPDRGLEELLNMWEMIRRELPDAELHIFYGWNYFDPSLWIPGQQEIKGRLLKLLHQDGVHWRGRVGQQQLALELQKADVWLYPPHGFRETCCMASIECQAAGVLCFYRMNGALGETVADRGIALSMVEAPHSIVRLITSTLQDKDRCDMMRERAREWAMKQTWKYTAEKVLEIYEAL